MISSGFSEVGNHQAEKDLVEAARRWGVRVIGPNCAGLMNPWHHHFPSIEVRALPGHTAFVTQSGAFGGATLGLAEERGFGFSKFVSYGNRCDVGDIELLEELGTAVARTSLCGLGQTAANPVLSTIRYFREEYEAHIYDDHCPAGVCQAYL